MRKKRCAGAGVAGGLGLAGPAGPAGPSGPAGPTGVVQALGEDLAVDLAIPINTPFVNLQSIALNTLAGSRLKVDFSAAFIAGVAASGSVSFRLLIDGVTAPAALGATQTVTVLDQSMVTGFAYLTPALAAGPHTVTIQWATVSVNAQIRAATFPSSEHASLVVLELAA